MKKLISVLLIILIVFSMIPIASVSVSAATTPANVSDATVKSRFDNLRNALVGKYFTVNGTYCNPAPGVGGHGCSNCLNGNVISANWFKNAVDLVPDSISLVPRHYCSNGTNYITPSAYSCAGFVNFVEWYLYSQKSTDDVYVNYLGSATVSYNGLKSINAKIGNVLRTNGDHSVVLYSYDSSKISYIQCNGTRSVDGNCKITFKTESYSTFTNSHGSTAGVTQARNSIASSTTTYTISYNANGGTGAPSSQTKVKDETLTLSSTVPTRPGYTFLGWSTSSSATSATYSAGDSFTRNGNTTLYAVWSQKIYTIRYDTNGGSNAPDSESHTYHETIAISSIIPYKFGYNFEGWSTSKSLAYTDIQPGDSYRVCGNKTFYAVWSDATNITKNTSYSANIKGEDHSVFFKITPSKTGEYVFESTGELDSMITIYCSDELSIAHDDDSGTDFNFYVLCTLNTDETYYIEIKTFSNSTGAIPFMAKEVYSISYHANGGSGAPTQAKKIYGEALTLSYDEPTRSGYTFLGWSTSSTATNATYSAGGSFNTDADTTLYAVWQKNHSHSYTETVTKAPTCTGTGVRTYKCSCGASYTQTISATGHKSSSWIVDENATVNAAGSKHKECTECGEVLEIATINQLKCSKPKLKTISNTSSGVKITWGKVGGADSYEVYRKVKGGSYSKVGTTRKTYFTDKKAKSGKKYYYVVKAVNEAGKSDSSSSLSKYYLADPSLKTPKSTKSGISLKWTKVTGAQGYIIYRKTGSGSYKKLKTEKGVSNLSYVDKSAKKGKKYTYKVKAYYSKTSSAYSNTKSITDKY